MKCDNRRYSVRDQYFCFFFIVVSATGQAASGKIRPSASWPLCNLNTYGIALGARTVTRVMKQTVNDLARQQVEATLGALSTSYNGDIVKRLRLTAVELQNVDLENDSELRPQKGKAKATVTVEIDVTRDMCNMGQNMHGGCTAFLLDVVSSMPLIALGNSDHWRRSGVSQNFNVLFLAPVPDGTKLRIVTTAVSFGLRSAVTDCQFFDRISGRLLATGHHTKVDVPAGKAKPKSKL